MDALNVHETNVDAAKIPARSDTPGERGITLLRLNVQWLLSDASERYRAVVVACVVETASA